MNRFNRELRNKTQDTRLIVIGTKDNKSSNLEWICPLKEGFPNQSNAKFSLQVNAPFKIMQKINDTA